MCWQCWLTRTVQVCVLHVPVVFQNLSGLRSGSFFSNSIAFVKITTSGVKYLMFFSHYQLFSSVKCEMKFTKWFMPTVRKVQLPPVWWQAVDSALPSFRPKNRVNIEKKTCFNHGKKVFLSQHNRRRWLSWVCAPSSRLCKCERVCVCACVFE